MTDRYAGFAHSGLGRVLVKRLGLPQPPRLRRFRPEDPVVAGPVLLGGDTEKGSRLGAAIRSVLGAAGAEIREPSPAAAEAGGQPEVQAGVQGPATEGSATEVRHAALVYDGTGITATGELRRLYDFFHPYARALQSSGRVVVFGTPPESCPAPDEATAQRALEGFVRSVGKEFGRGTTAQLVYVAPGAEEGIASTLRFLLSARSAYVSGQVIRITPAPVPPAQDWQRPLAGQVALVTGAARGIGAAIAKVLARDGAHVVGLDVPAAGEALSAVANDIGGTAYQLDLTAPEAPERLAEYLRDRYGRIHVVVHNAGITRDKTLARMRPDAWDAVLDVNLASQERIDAVLLDRGVLADGGRIISVSSVSGIAGNRGQTNYATSKAGVIGRVQALAPVLRDRGITVNAVAPGFIETAMTARMPVAIREAGRRMNSMAQGGLPADVAETVAWFASPGSAGVTGNVVRVCGQSMLGA
jgi:3-oxoacyl-[acyl-carrier protein] reductase